MNQIDCKQAQNVWSRVMAAQAGAQGTSANPPVQVKAAQEERRRRSGRSRRTNAAMQRSSRRCIFF